MNRALVSCKTVPYNGMYMNVGSPKQRRRRMGEKKIFEEIRAMSAFVLFHVTFSVPSKTPGRH